MTCKELINGVAGVASIALAAFLGGCKGGDVNQNVIVPVVASVTMDTPEPTSSPLAFLRELPGSTPNSTTDDLVTFKLILRPSGSLQYRGFTLDVQFDPGKVQLAGIVGGPTGIQTPVGICPLNGGQGSDVCDPLCLFNLTGNDNANATGHLIVGVYLESKCVFPHLATGEESLMTLGFRAATNISTMQEGRIQLITGPGSGDCEILDTVGVAPADLGIPFDDRQATIVTN
jgi:hypothetical protein